MGSFFGHMDDFVLVLVLFILLVRLGLTEPCEPKWNYGVGFPLQGIGRDSTGDYLWGPGI